MGCLWRSHRITNENKPPSRSNVYYLYWQGGCQSPQWPAVSKRWRKSRHKQSAGVKGKSLHRENKLTNRMQEQAESIDTYITTLRALAETCDFGTLKDDLLRDRIVCGVRENVIRRKLLQESGLTLSKCVDICRANEATAAQLKALRRANSLNKKQTRSTKKKITRRRRHLDKMVKVQKIS